MKNGNLIAKFTETEISRYYSVELDTNSTNNSNGEVTRNSRNVETERFGLHSANDPNTESSSINNRMNTNLEYPKYVQLPHQNVTSPVNLTNWNSVVYATIHDAISKMQDLKPDEYCFLKFDIGEKAKGVLSLIKDHVELDPPKIIYEDGDELIFTWSTSCNKYYLTIEEDEIYFMELDKETVDTKSDVISRGSELNVQEFLNYFKKIPRRKTMNIREWSNAG